MKRILSLILVAAMLLSVLVSAGITASAAETVVVDFDNATNFVAHFNTSMSIEGTNIKQGTGSMRLDFAIPTGQASNIGGMVVYTAPTSIDLSAYTTATLDVWFPGKMSGSQGIQVNFATGASNQDGFNYMYAVDNFEAGWHTITFDLTNPPVSVNGASWATIDVVRITWFNNAQISTPNFMLLDNLKAFDSASAGNTPSTTAAAPYKSGTELIVNDADSTNGWSCDFGGTISAGTQVKAGGSVSLKTENILDNAGLVGGMAHISLPVTNMSGYKDISFDVYFDQALVGAHQLQINFASNNEEDGFNYIFNVSDTPVGWKTYTAEIASVSGVGSANWSAINRIRLTWFNLAQQDIKEVFTFDNIKLTGGSASGDSSSSDTVSSAPSVSVSGDPVTPSGNAPAPYKSGTDLIVNDAESLAGWGTHFQTGLAAGTEVKTGSGSVALHATAPVGQNANIGAMGYIVLPASNMSGYTGISIDIHFSKALTGAHQFQVNFCSAANPDDGFNFTFNVSDVTAGWHTYTADIAGVPAISGANWSAINRIRFAWFNLCQANITEVFTIDNLKLTGGTEGGTSSSVVVPASDEAHVPYKEGDDLIVHNAESINGWTTAMQTTVEKSSVASQGNASVALKALMPVGQNGNIGAMAFLKIPASDLSGYNTILLDLNLSQPLNGAHQLQINFITDSSKEDGINFIADASNSPAGWNTMEFKVKNGSNVLSASWNSISRIRFTWFNLAQQSGDMTIYFDNLRFSMGHLAKEDGNDILLHSFDNRLGLSSELNTKLEIKSGSVGTYIQEGVGSLKVTPLKAVGQASNIAARVLVSFDAKAVLTDITSFSIKMRNMTAFSGKQTLKINFMSSTSSYEGFNYEFDLTDAKAGWHTLKVNVDDYVSKENTPSLRWANINRIIITWHNDSQVAYDDVVYFDDFRAYTNAEESSDAVISSEPVSSDVSSDDTPSVDEPAYPYGDVDENGSITSADALMALQYSVQKVQLTERQKIIADVAKPLSVNSSDALAILQYSVKKITEFDPPAHPVTSVPDTSSTPVSSDAPSSSTPVSSGEVSIPTSLITNGAYTKDPSADTNYMIDTTGLKPKTIYLVTSAVPGTSADHARLVYSLQGLINRDFGMEGGHTSLVYMNGVDASDTTWYQYMIEETDSVFYGYSRVIIRNWEDFYTTFENQIKGAGMILWDGNVPATSNVAATICGLDGYLPVRSGSDLETELKAKGVTVKQSLVGMFTGSGTIPGTSQASTGSPKNDAYRWALEKYMNRCSTTYLAYTLDGASVTPGNPCSTDAVAFLHCLPNHDYLIARRCFFFDLDPYALEAAADAGGGKVGLDNETMLMIFQRRYERANGFMGQLMGFTPWWLKYTTDCETYKGKQYGAYLEWVLCEYLGAYNLAKEADAASPTHMSNGSAFYKYVVTKKIEYNKTIKVTNFDPNTYYYTIFPGDYDSSAWLKKYVSTFWRGDNARGTVDYLWPINPNLSYRVPVIFDFMNKNQTDCDYLVADEGAGYVIPHGLFQGKKMSYTQFSRPAGNPDARQIWADYNKQMYKMLGYDITGFIINGDNKLDRDIFACYAQFSTAAFHLDPTNKFVSVNGVPFIYLTTNYDDAVANRYNIMTNTSLMGSYKFNGFRIANSSPTQVKEHATDTYNYCTGKGITAKYVDPYSFFYLAKQSGRLKAI